MSTRELQKKGRLLIVDDEQTFLESTAELLRQNDYACDVATDGSAALKKLRQTSYDTVIADIRMPGNADLELVEQLGDRSPEVPIILVTGYPSMETAVDSVNLDVDAYLVKPFDMDELLGHINTAVKQRRTARLVQRVRDRARRRVQEFDELDPGSTGSASLIEPIFDLIFQDVTDAYVDLKQLCMIAEEHSGDALAAVLRNDPEKKQLAEAVQHAIDVIEETKKSFKSKQLAQLRSDLEDVLEETPLP
jgi:ActR/RegA family two-component response regulator